MKSCSLRAPGNDGGLVRVEGLPTGFVVFTFEEAGGNHGTVMMRAEDAEWIGSNLLKIAANVRRPQ